MDEKLYCVDSAKEPEREEPEKVEEEPEKVEEEPEKVEEEPEKFVRIYSWDWGRIVGSFLVMFVHTLMSSNWTLSKTKYDRNTHPVYDKIEFLYRIFFLLGMPYFHIIAGRGMSQLVRQTYFQQIKSKCKRLLVPYIFGYLVIIIPAAFISRSWRPGISERFDNFFVFYWDMLSNLKFTGGWLWTMAIIFVCNITFFPFVQEFSDAITGKRGNSDSTFKRCFNFIVLLSLQSAIAVYAHQVSGLTPFFTLLPSAASCLLLGYAKIYSCMKESFSKETRIRYIYLGYLLLPACFVYFALILETVLKRSTCNIEGRTCRSRIYATWLLLQMSFLLGCVDATLSREFKKLEGERSSLYCYAQPLMAFFKIGMIALSAPNEDYPTRWPFYLPNYRSTELQVLSVLGILAWQSALDDIFEKFNHLPVNKEFYNFWNKSSIFIYVIHWLFMDCFSFFAINWELDFQSLLVLTYLSGLIPTLLLFKIIQKSKLLGLFGIATSRTATTTAEKKMD